MGVPASEVSHTSATTGRGDHEVHKGNVVALAKKILLGNIIYIVIGNKGFNEISVLRNSNLYRIIAPPPPPFKSYYHCKSIHNVRKLEERCCGTLVRNNSVSFSEKCFI
jgi:hypothetical protein